MKKFNMCQCSTSKDCINYVRTGKIGDVSCRHYVNPSSLPGVVKSDYECINYVTEEGLKEYKAILEDDNDYDDEYDYEDDFDEEETDYYNNDDISDSYNEGYVAGSNAAKISYDNAYQAGYDQGYEDACLDECDDEETFEVSDDYVSGILREDRDKPIYIAINKENPMHVLALQETLFENSKFFYSSDAEKLKRFVNKYKPEYVTDLIIIDFDVYKKSFETKEEPMEERFLCNIKFVK